MGIFSLQNQVKKVLYKSLAVVTGMAKLTIIAPVDQNEEMSYIAMH